MSSYRIPTTQCVHIFNGEFQQLKDRLGKPMSINRKQISGLNCYLYGLWTHSSNVVVHLVVSNKKECDYAKTHRLDCVGYVAESYNRHLYDEVQKQTKLSTIRQHIIVDVSETKRLNSLRAYGTHHDAVREIAEANSQGQPLQVNILPSESPFRNELYKINPGMRNINGYKIESENDSGPYSVVSSNTADNISQEQILKVVSENQVGNELCDMNRGSGRASINGNSVESETAFYREDEMNGHQDTIEASPSAIDHLKHKIKCEFGLSDEDIPVEESLENSSLVLHFTHNGKQWQIELKEDPASRKTFAEILFSELREDSSPMKAYSQEFNAQNVLVKIKKICQCEKCKK